jgi:endoglucanase
VAGLAAAVTGLTGGGAVAAVASRTTAPPGASSSTTPAQSPAASGSGQGAHALSRSGNLLAGQSASFDGGIGSWLAYTSGTSVAPSSEAQSGSGSMIVTSSRRAAAEVGSGSPSTAIPASPGETYSASIQARAASTGTQVAGVLVFYSSSGTSIGSAWGQPVQDQSSAWTGTDPVVGLAPAGTAGVVFYVTMTELAPGAAQYLDSASVIGGGGGAAPIVAPLRTEGNRIYDAYGPVVLRGVVIDGTELGLPDFPTDSEIGRAAAWGSNLVRVPLNESLWLNTCTAATTSNSSAYPARVAAEVNSITSRHMVALLDLHFNVTHLCGRSAPQAMADLAFSPTFWDEVAARFASNPLVAFDLYNEPHDISDSVWLGGGTSTYGGIPFQTAGMQRLYDAVRAQAPTNLVFDSGNTWANDPSSLPLKGVDIVDAVHDYTCQTLPCSAADPYDPSPILSRWTTVEESTPVAVTEFGFPGRFDGTFNTNLVAAAGRAGIGWVAFAFDPTGTPFSLLTDGAGAYEPLPGGMPVLAGLSWN